MLGAGPWLGAVEGASGGARGGRPLRPAPPAFCRCSTCPTFSLKRRFFCLILASSALRLASRSGSCHGRTRR